MMRSRRKVLFQPNTVLVTGGAGFIGSNFIHYILSRSDSVHVINIDTLTYAADLRNLEQLPDAERHVFVEGDITDRGLLDELFAEHRIDSVVHFAAESHVDRSIVGPDAFVKTNLIGTFRLLEAARHAWKNSLDYERVRFHHISTDEVYGALTDDEPGFSESSPYAPNSPYSASKAGSDHLVRSYFETYGVPVTTSNCSNNYGPRQHNEKLIPKVISACLSGAEIPVYGDGRNVRDWLFVEDHCEAVWKIITEGVVGCTYNIGGGEEKRNIELVTEICALMDELQPTARSHTERIRLVTDREGHDWRYAIDFSFIRSALDWEPRHDFESGLRATIEWYMK